MALGKNCTSKARPCFGLRRTTSKGLDFGNNNNNCITATTTRTLGRKRVVVSNYMEEELSSTSTSTPSPCPPLKTPSKKKRIGTRLNSQRDDDLCSSTLCSPFKTPTKKNRFGSRLLDLETSSLEALPQDILVRLLCCVDHDDLKQLFHVSPIVREATLIAKDWHFAFSTPSSKTAAMRSFGDLENPNNQFDMATPNAPKRCGGSYRPRISREKLNDISVALFKSPEEEVWEKKNCGLFMETEVGLSM